jgi:hypothetical protein
MTAPRPCSVDLGTAQLAAAQGPWGPPMSLYTCTGCGFVGFDTQLYFYNTPADRCIWCRKYPKVAKKATVDKKD